jgi:hypothetical protein
MVNNLTVEQLYLISTEEESQVLELAEVAWAIEVVAEVSAALVLVEVASVVVIIMAAMAIVEVMVIVAVAVATVAVIVVAVVVEIAVASRGTDSLETL